MLIKTILLLAIIIAAIVGVASTKPDEFAVTRSTTINAPAPAIFEHVNDLHKWNAWSPWYKLDPDAKQIFSGPDSGTGATMAWDGSMQVGKGRMTITDTKPAERISFALDFEKPMKGTSTSEFTFKQEGNATLVTWSMNGKSSLMAKVMSLFMNCDKMVGENFDQGLASLKTISEGK